MCKLKCIGEKMFLNKNIFKDYLAFEQQVCVHLENMSVCHTDLPKSVLAGVGEWKAILWAISCLPNLCR